MRSQVGAESEKSLWAATGEDGGVLYIQPAPLTSMRAQRPVWKLSRWQCTIVLRDSWGCCDLQNIRGVSPPPQVYLWGWDDRPPRGTRGGYRDPWRGSRGPWGESLRLGIPWKSWKGFFRFEVIINKILLDVHPWCCTSLASYGLAKHLYFIHFFFYIIKVLVYFMNVN